MKCFSNLVLTCIILLALSKLSYAQSKVSIAVDHPSFANADTFYFQKNQSNSVNLGFSDQVSSIFIGRGSGTISYGIRNIGLGKLSLNKNGDGYENIAIGAETLRSNTNGFSNIGIGSDALELNDEGWSNIAIGTFALNRNSDGNFNIGIGTGALAYNEEGFANIAIGANTLFGSGNGSSNIAMGMDALRSNGDGFDNVGVGKATLSNNTVGANNIALGNHALYSNTTKSGIVAIGDSSLVNNGTGALIGGPYSGDASGNTAIGYQSMVQNTTGFSNTVMGSKALSVNTIGDRNTVIGFEAGFSSGTNLNDNTFVGYQSGYTNAGNANVFLGAFSGLNETGSDKLYIDNTGTTTPLIYGEFNNDLLRINNKLGVGTDPDATNIINALSTTSNRIKVESTTGSFSGFLSKTSGAEFFAGARSDYYQIADNNAGATRIAIESNGNVGVGTRASEDLHVRADGETVLKLQSKTNNVGSRIKFRQSNESGADLYYEGSSDELRIESFSSGSSNGDYMRMDPFNGELDLQGRMNIKGLSTSTDLLLLEKNDGTDVLKVDAALNPTANLTAFLNIDSPEQGLTFPDDVKAIQVNGEFLMNSNGQIMIGGSGTPQRDIHIKQSNSTRGIRLENDLGYWDVFTDGLEDYNFYNNGSLRAYIQDGTGSFVITSDRSLKENIRSLGSTLDQINRISPVSYSYKVDRERRKSYGVVAQELQEVYPEMVFEKDGKLGVAYDNLIPIAIKGIQELSEENKQLETEVIELKKEIEALQNLEDRIQKLEEITKK